MAKTITRKNLKLFGSTGDVNDFAEFGSEKSGSPLKTKDIDTIQSLTRWLTGLTGATLDVNKAPFLEDINGLLYVFCYQLAYMLQDGIPEWQTDTLYYIGSMVRKAGTSEIYASLTDDNAGNSLPNQADNANWHFIPQAGLTGEIKAYGGNSAPAGFLLCDGTAISRTTYANLFNVVGTNFGIGDGTTTFNLPDLRGRAPVGIAPSGTFNPIGATPGAETHSQVQAPHFHTVDSHVHPIPHRHPSPVSARSVLVVENARTDLAGWPYGISTIPSSQVGAATSTATTATTQFLNTGDPSNANSGATAPDTDSKTPAISDGSSIQPSLVVNFIIKT